MKYWLFKSEPSTFSIDHLAKRPKQTEPWDGVRNYQARNMLRDDIKTGDLVFFYHSNCKEPGIAGIAKVVKDGYPDTKALDPDSDYYDPKATRDKPIWYRVDVKLVEKFSDIVTLASIRENFLLQDMVILRRGNRLSITPVTKDEWKIILKMAK